VQIREQMFLRFNADFLDNVFNMPGTMLPGSDGVILNRRFANPPRVLQLALCLSWLTSPSGRGHESKGWGRRCRASTSSLTSDFSASSGSTFGTFGDRLTGCDGLFQEFPLSHISVLNRARKSVECSFASISIGV
jgi:hypothetical protein